MMPSKFLSFFISLFIFMTYGLTHIPAPAFLNSECTTYAEDEEFDTPEEIADELDDVTEEDFLEDQEEAVEEQEEEVIEEVKKN